jgi:hypothetical protein
MVNNRNDSVENPFNKKMTTGYLFGVIVWMGIAGLQPLITGVGESEPKN